MICSPISWHLRGGIALVGAARGQVLHLLGPLHRLRAADGCLAGLVAKAAARVVLVPVVVVASDNDWDYRGGAAPRLVLQQHSACRFKLTLKCSVLSLHSLDALAFTA